MTWQERAQATVQSEKRQAREKVRRAKRLLSGGRKAEAEEVLRSALGNLRRAFLWDDRSTALLRALHRLGLRIHNRFGCQVPIREGCYHAECPIMLAHAKVGFSMGGSAEAECSICGEDPFGCPHVTGEVYDGVEARRIGSACSICHREGPCEHLPGHQYDRVEAVRILTKLRIDEISLVDKPANPDAVIFTRTITKDEILESLPEGERRQLVYGVTPLFCHHCTLCQGD